MFNIKDCSISADTRRITKLRFTKEYIDKSGKDR